MVPDPKADAGTNRKWQVAGHEAMNIGCFHLPAAPQIRERDSEEHGSAQMPQGCQLGIERGNTRRQQPR